MSSPSSQNPLQPQSTSQTTATTASNATTTGGSPVHSSNSTTGNSITSGSQRHPPSSEGTEEHLHIDDVSRGAAVGPQDESVTAYMENQSTKRAQQGRNNNKNSHHHSVSVGAHDSDRSHSRSGSVDGMSDEEDVVGPPVHRMPSSYLLPELPHFVDALKHSAGAPIPQYKHSMFYKSPNVEAEFLHWLYGGTKYTYHLLHVVAQIALVFFAIVYGRYEYWLTFLAAAFTILAVTTIRYTFGYRFSFPMCCERVAPDYAAGNEILIVTFLLLGLFFVALPSAQYNKWCVEEDGMRRNFQAPDASDPESKFYCHHMINTGSVGLIIIPIVLAQPRFIITATYLVCNFCATVMSPVIFGTTDFRDYYHRVFHYLPFIILASVLRYFSERSLRSQFNAIGRLNLAVIRVHDAKEERKEYVESLFPPAVRNKMFHSKRMYIIDRSKQATCVMVDIADFPIWCTQRLPRDAAIVAAAVTDILTQEALNVDVTTVYATGDVFCGCCNLIQPRKHHTLRAVCLAIRAFSQMFHLQAQFKAAVQLRCAIHTGLLYGDVIGETNLRYSVYGPAQQVAASILSCCTPQVVLASEASHLAYGDQVKDRKKKATMETAEGLVVQLFEVLNTNPELDLEELLKVASSDDDDSKEATSSIESGVIKNDPSAKDTNGLSGSNITGIDGSGTDLEGSTAGASNSATVVTSTFQKEQRAAMHFMSSMMESSEHRSVRRILQYLSRGATDSWCFPQFTAELETRFLRFFMYNCRAETAFFQVFLLCFMLLLIALAEASHTIESTMHDEHEVVKAKRDLHALEIICFIVSTCVAGFCIAITLINWKVSEKAIGKREKKESDKTWAVFSSIERTSAGSDSNNQTSSCDASIEDGSASLPTMREEDNNEADDVDDGKGTSEQTSSATPFRNKRLSLLQNPNSYRNILLICCIIRDVIFLAGLAASRPSTAGNNTIWLALVQCIGYFMLMVQSFFFGLAMILLIGASVATQFMTDLPFVSYDVMIVEVLFTVIIFILFSTRVKRLRLHFRFIKVQEAITEALHDEEETREKMLSAVIPEAIQTAAQLGRNKNTLEVTSLSDLIVCAVQFNNTVMLPKSGNFSSTSSPGSTNVRKTMKHSMAVFETALTMLCPKCVAVVNSMGDTLMIAGPLFSSKDNIEDKKLSNLTVTAAVSLLKTLCYMKQKKIPFTAVMTFEMGFGVLSNARFPKYDVLGVAVYTARALLAAAPPGSAAVSNKLFNYLKVVNPMQIAMQGNTVERFQFCTFNNTTSGTSGQNTVDASSSFALDQLPLLASSGSANQVQQGERTFALEGTSPMIKRSGGSHKADSSSMSNTGHVSNLSITAVVQELDELHHNVDPEVKSSMSTAAVGAGVDLFQFRPHLQKPETWRIRGIGAVTMHQISFKDNPAHPSSPTNNGGGGLHSGRETPHLVPGVLMASTSSRHSGNASHTADPAFNMETFSPINQQPEKQVTPPVAVLDDVGKF